MGKKEVTLEELIERLHNDIDWSTPLNTEQSRLYIGLQIVEEIVEKIKKEREVHPAIEKLKSKNYHILLESERDWLVERLDKLERIESGYDKK